MVTWELDMQSHVTFNASHTLNLAAPMVPKNETLILLTQCLAHKKLDPEITSQPYTTGIWDNGKENGNYYSRIGYILGIYGIMEKWKLLFRV